MIFELNHLMLYAFTVDPRMLGYKWVFLPRSKVGQTSLLLDENCPAPSCFGLLDRVYAHTLSLLSLHNIHLPLMQASHTGIKIMSCEYHSGTIGLLIPLTMYTLASV